MRNDGLKRVLEAAERERERALNARLAVLAAQDALDAENHASDLRVEHFDGSWRDREAPRE